MSWYHISFVVMCLMAPRAVDSCPLTCEDGAELITDPNHCGKFYVCFPHGADGPYVCPEDLPYFNGTDCAAHYGCCTDPCKPFCVAGGTEIPDPFDCSGYYFCIGEGTPSEDMHYYCPEGENYDPVEGFCHISAPCNLACKPSTTEPPTPGPSTEPPTPGPSTEPPTPGPSTEPPTPGPSTEPPTPGPSTEPPTPGPSTELPTPGPSTEPPTPGPSTELPTPGPSTELPTPGPSTEPPTPGPSTEPPNVCLDELLCQAEGLFPRCNFCHPDYFECSGADNYATLNRCDPGEAFNPVPEHPFCVRLAICPFYPPYLV